MKEYVNLGIAAATPRGLSCRTSRTPDGSRCAELAEALSTSSPRRRAGPRRPTWRGGTITITNVGVFGVDTGTPILNPGEAAILCFGAVRPMPWVHRGRGACRAGGQLALSFDHRIVDGELGSQVLADVGRFLTDPGGAAARLDLSHPDDPLLSNI